MMLDETAPWRTIRATTKPYESYVSCTYRSKHPMSELNAEALKAAHIAFASGGVEGAVAAYLAAMPKRESEAYGYLSRLLKSVAAHVEPLPDLMGVCTQIDNLIAGLRAPKQEHDELERENSYLRKMVHDLGGPSDIGQPLTEPSGDVERLRRAIRGLIDEVALCKYTKTCEPLMIAVSEADTALQRSYRAAKPLPDAPKEPEIVSKCADCGRGMTKAEGGTVFTVCEACWDKNRVPKQEPSGWRPIASAPRDGTRVLLWWPYWRSHAPVIGWWQVGGWQADCVLSEFESQPPTHWQTLPDPPKGDVG